MNNIFVIVFVSIMVFVIMNFFYWNTQIIKNDNQTENFDNTEGLSNLASMYQDGKLIINELEVNGDIKLTGNIAKKDNAPVKILNGADIENGISAGNAYIGNWSGSHAIFSHKDKKGGYDFCVLQRNDGTTVVNSANKVEIRKNNDQTKGGAEIGNAYVGSWGSDNAHAVFSHKDNNNNSYCTLQDADGNSRINSVDMVKVRKNNDDATGRLSLSMLHPVHHDIAWNHPAFGALADSIGLSEDDFMFFSRSPDKMSTIGNKLTPDRYGKRVGWVGIWDSHHQGGANY